MGFYELGLGAQSVPPSGLAPRGRWVGHLEAPSLVEIQRISNPASGKLRDLRASESSPTCNYPTGLAQPALLANGLHAGCRNRSQVGHRPTCNSRSTLIAPGLQPRAIYMSALWGVGWLYFEYYTVHMCEGTRAWLVRVPTSAAQVGLFPLASATDIPCTNTLQSGSLGGRALAGPGSGKAGGAAPLPNTWN